MAALELTQDVPLVVSEDGSMRVADSRVTLDSVLHHYREGATAEEIALRFPALRLADIHSCLAYYLNHEAAVDDYLSQQQRRAEDLQRRVSSDPAQRKGVAALRERIGKRLKAKSEAVS